MNNKKIWLSVFSICIAGNLAICAPAKKSVVVAKKAVPATNSVNSINLNDKGYDNIASIEKQIANINVCLDRADFENANKFIQQAVKDYPKEVQFKIFSAISLIMQDKLDSAQDMLDNISQSARVYDDFYYAQGTIYLKRIETSDMAFRGKRNDYINLSIDYFNKALLINPKNARVYNALGVAYIKKEDLYKAEASFKKAIELKPRYATALDNLGTVYYITNELEQAEVYFKDAEAANPTSPTVYYHLAQVKLKNNDLNKALYYANKSLLWNKRSAYTQNLIGEIYRKQGNEAAAIASFKKSIFLKPEYTVPYLNLAAIYESRSDICAALEELKTCYSISPDNDDVKLAIADLDLSNNQYSDAIKFYSMVTDKYKAQAVQGIVSAYYALALDSANKAMFRSCTKLNDALAYINDAIDKDPDNLELYLTKSKLNKLINNQIESKEVLLKIVSNPNSNLPDLLTKAEAFTALQRYRDARNTYERIIMTSKSIESDLYLAEYLTYNKQYKLAKNALNNVLIQEPDNIDAQRNLAFIDKALYRSEREYTNALYFNKKRDLFFRKAYLNKTIKIDPNNIDANLMLGKILRREKDIYGANKCYKVVQGASDDTKLIKKVNKISRNLDKKIAKKEAKEVKKVKVVPANATDSQYVQPVNYKPLVNTKVEDFNKNINEIKIDSPVTQPVGI